MAWDVPNLFIPKNLILINPENFSKCVFHAYCVDFNLYLNYLSWCNTVRNWIMSEHVEILETF